MDTTAEQQTVTGEISQRTDKQESAPILREPAAEQIVFTLNTDGSLASVEKIDANGSRFTLSTDECAVIAGDDIDEIEAALEAGYETGILEGLGDDDLFERIMLLRLITREGGENIRALRRTMLRRILLRRLLRRSASNWKREK